MEKTSYLDQVYTQKGPQPFETAKLNKKNSQNIGHDTGTQRLELPVSKTVLWRIKLHIVDYKIGIL